MQTQRKNKKHYPVHYNSDPRLIVDNHLSSIIYLTDVDVKYFTSLAMAIAFMSECVSPITTIEDLMPELDYTVKIEYVLPESHIRPKHQLMAMSDMEEIFTNFDGDWSKA